MARIASIAIGGYFPTPKHLIPRIAGLFQASPVDIHSFMDPCAGDGEAIVEIVKILCPNQTSRTSKLRTQIVGIEMEETRSTKLGTNIRHLVNYGDGLVGQGDAFSAKIEIGERGGISFLYLNPPYDQDPTYKRLEERFLARFHGVVRVDGYLVFVVPGHALAASANTLATHFDSLECFRFPEPDYDIYKQVVLVARKTGAKMEADLRIEAQVRAWAIDHANLPVLPETPDWRFSLPPSGTSKYRSHGEDGRVTGIDRLTMEPLDTAELLANFRPWASDRGGTENILPSPTEDLLSRTYPIAMPPRPAHIAAGIAAGVFNGNRITPDNPESKSPALLVKGVFNREFRTVEEKTNKDGMVTGEVQVQQPTLSVTVLDLSTSKYHTLASTVAPTGSTDPSKFSTGDLLSQYGSSLLDALRQRCPVLHDPSKPEHEIPLPVLDRPLYRAQAQAVMAAVKILGGDRIPLRKRQGKSVAVLGEIGSGKTGVAITTALACGASRILVMCPPHLLDGWKEQICAIRSDITTVVLSDVTDVQRFAKMTNKGVVIALLSRETAKLGHGWVGAGLTCPKCGALTPKVDLAKKRARCSHKGLSPKDEMAFLLQTFASILLKAWPDELPAKLFASGGSQRVRELFLGRVKGNKDAKDAEIAKVRKDARIVDILNGLLMEFMELGYGNSDSPIVNAIFHLLAAHGDKDLIAETALRVLTAYNMTKPEEETSYGYGYTLKDLGRSMALLLPPGSDEQTKLLADMETVRGGRVREFVGIREKIRAMLGTKDDSNSNQTWAFRDFSTGVEDEDGTGKATKYKGLAFGDSAGYVTTFGIMASRATWHVSPECGGELFQAVPEPLRYPLATYITKHHPKALDFLIIDEAHELATDGSAQERAGHRLTGLKHPTLILTGSVMNGYAESLFSNWWGCFDDFRQEFKRADRQLFVDRYGYRKRLVQNADKVTGEIVEYGSMSDRVERREKDLGNAPGVLPLFVLKHLLKHAVTIHKSDLACDIPKFTEIPVNVEMNNEQGMRHSYFLSDLLRQIKTDRFTPLAGKLWGAMSESPSQLDRATLDTGNAKDGAFEAVYPRSMEDKTLAGKVVARAEPFPVNFMLPKEVEMLKIVAQELSEGRNVMVFTWHVDLMPRLQRLLQTLTSKVPILDPAKVDTKKRIAWIEKNVVQAGARVMLTNPVCVQTGINNLVHFSSIWWHENPACNAIIKRQAEGRIDRIGQRLETRAYTPRYTGSAQVDMYELLMHKVAVSQATDGLDAESALQAAGVGEAGLVTGFSIGKELYNRVSKEGW